MFSGKDKILLIVAFLVPTLSLAEQEGQGGGGQAIAGGLIALGAAAGQAGAAAAKAGADREVAKINAGSQVAQTQIAANTSMYLADSQKDISLYNAMISAQMNQANNEQQTKNLETMIDFRKWSRLIDAREDSQERKEEYQLQLAQLQLKRENMKMEMELKRQAMMLQYQTAGLQGVATAGGKSALSVTRTFSPTMAANQVQRPATTAVSRLTAMRAAIPTGIPSGSELKSVAGRLSNLFAGTLASGSTRALRKKSDLASFQEQGPRVPMRGLASQVRNEEGLVRHNPNRTESIHNHTTHGGE